VAATTHSTLPAWSRRLISELEVIDQRTERLARGLEREQLNWQPTTGAWSVGQCLEHLLKTNEIYLPAISISLDGRRQSQVQEVTPGWFGRWFIRNYIAPSSKGTRAQAPKKIQPAKSVEFSVVDAFLRSNNVVRELIARASEYDVNRIRFKNPFIPLLRFTVGTGLEIISKHQNRHLLQAERVRQSSAFPG
jgi:hypothetical protein